MKELKEELWAVIKRYSDESDLNTEEAIMALEAIKFALLTAHCRFKIEHRDEEE